MKEHWKEENLKEIVKTSKSQKQTLQKLGIRSAGSNFAVLKKYLQLYDIDTSHFGKCYDKIALMSKMNGYHIDSILVENSTYSRSHLKRRLFEDGLKQHICEKCGQGEIWNGEKMSLVLDHINGIYNDNRLENLRMLCPNCNATLPTHCRKHKNEIKENEKKEKILKIEKNKLENNIRIEKIRQKLLNSNINFSKFGWVKEAAPIIGCIHQHVNKWMIRHVNSFYMEKCFIRKTYNK